MKDASKTFILTATTTAAKQTTAARTRLLRLG
jgi:hypothetical protein